MAVTGISEFTFGYGFLYEQTQNHWNDLRAAPILPSLIQEADEGWDAHLPLQGVDFYYQFKLSDYLSRSNAKYIRDGMYQEPYYRISLHRRDNNKQHTRLLEHAQQFPNTYYVAPEFSGLAEFNDSFLSRQILIRSRLIPINECDSINDGEQHYITFQSGRTNWRQHSEPKEHQNSVSGRSIENVYRRSARNWKPIDRGYAQNLLEENIGIIEQRLSLEQGVTRSVRDLLRVPQVRGNPTVTYLEPV